MSASDVQLTDRPIQPRALTAEGTYYQPFAPLGTLGCLPVVHAEVREYVQLYATAASNAVHAAGFDGVEIHAGNGYLIDQFVQEITNKRTDEYGGSIEKRARFALEVVDAITEGVGAEKTGIRFSPWTTFNGMFCIDARFKDLGQELMRLTQAWECQTPSRRSAILYGSWQRNIRTWRLLML